MRFPAWTFPGYTFYRNRQIPKDISQKPVTERTFFPKSVFHNFFIFVFIFHYFFQFFMILFHFFNDFLPFFIISFQFFTGSVFFSFFHDFFVVFSRVRLAIRSTSFHNFPQNLQNHCILNGSQCGAPFHITTSF